MASIQVDEKSAMETNDKNVSGSNSIQSAQERTNTVSPDQGAEPNRPWWHPIIEPGHAVQIIIAAVVAIAIGLGVTAAVGKDNIPEAAPAILGIPGQLWLRALQAVVIPMIVCAMILSVQSLREIAKGGAALARWTIFWYIITTVFSVAFSIVMSSQVWEPRYRVASDEALDRANVEGDLEDLDERKPHEVAVDLFNTFVPNNLAKAFAENQLLAIIISSIVVGYLIRPERGQSGILRAVKEVNEMVSRIIAVLVKLAPIGVFFLILPNMFRLDVNDVGVNLGLLIAGTISSMMFHLFITLPLLFFVITRRNPYVHWFKCSKAWITAWGTASSAGTLPVVIRCLRERGYPDAIISFTAPLGCMLNMDGAAIYFPSIVIFLAKTQGMSLNAGHYIMILLLSTLAAIGSTPIPAAALVLSIMVATSAGVPITGMYAVVIAIDWLLDRFRTMVNTSGDLYAVPILAKITGIKDPQDLADDQIGQVHSNTVRDNEDRV